MSEIFNNFPVFNLERFVLRQPRKSDSGAFVEYLNNDEVNFYIPEESIARTILRAEEEITYLRNMYNYKHSLYWVIATHKEDKVIGSCGFNYWNRYHKRAEISYDLSREYWSNGIMSNALDKIIDFSFNKMELKRIEAAVTPCNHRSIKLLQGKGFKTEGIMKNHKVLNGIFTDAIMMALIS